MVDSDPGVSPLLKDQVLATHFPNLIKLATLEAHHEDALVQKDKKYDKLSPKKRKSEDLQTLVPWIGNFENNHILQHYWMLGQGSPKPITYHHPIDLTISGRVERL